MQCSSHRSEDRGVRQSPSGRQVLTSCRPFRCRCNSRSPSKSPFPLRTVPCTRPSICHCRRCRPSAQEMSQHKSCLKCHRFRSAVISCKWLSSNNNSPVPTPIKSNRNPDWSRPSPRLRQRPRHLIPMPVRRLWRTCSYPMVRSDRSFRR